MAPPKTVTAIVKSFVVGCGNTNSAIPMAAEAKRYFAKFIHGILIFIILREMAIVSARVKRWADALIAATKTVASKGVRNG